MQPIIRSWNIRRVLLLVMLTITFTTTAVQARSASDYTASLCQPRVYAMTWDGWQGTLQLCFENGEASWLQQGNVRHKVTFTEGRRTGYDHRVIMRVDFNDTPAVFQDDQRFEGYFLTKQTLNQRGIAGLTWWDGTPFGFYATRVR